MPNRGMMKVKGNMDNCKSVAGLAVDLWKKFGSLAPAGVIALEQKLEAMINAFNALVKNHPSLTVGPRPLVFDRLETGDIIAFGDRTWVGVAPTTQPSKVVVTKTHGLDHVQMFVCGIDSNGGHHDLATIDIAPNTPDQHSFTAQIPANQIPIVLLDGKALTRTMSYKIVLTAA
jgi:hypothetical protein